MNKKLGALMLTVFCTLLLLAGVSALLTPVPALAAASDLLEITGDGVTNPATFTLDQLKDMEQRQYVYSCINTWPTKKWYVGKGVKLSDLLAQAGMTQEATLIRFTSVDSYTVTLTVKELFEDKRYRFPNFKNGADGDGHIPGDPSGKVEVEPIVGLVSVEGSDNPKYMNDLNTLLLMMGQRTVTEQTGNLFVKGLHRIEVLTDEPQKWDAPQANPGSGTVPVGSIITLSNIYTDDDKIYYTTDGSIPTMDSPMYNWVARRWWPSRADVLGTINRPIGPINQDTTIKAITIGPGKLDSEVVTFTYKIAGDGDDPKPTAKVIQLTIGKTEASVDGMPYTLDARPYINAEAGRTLVPVRFISEALNAEVAWDPITRQVTIKDDGEGHCSHDRVPGGKGQRCVTNH
ncbi:MAG: FN3 associated domain-containing protein [Syntrophomonadales bacterium]